MPLFGGKKDRKDPGDAFEEAKSALSQAEEEYLLADKNLTALEEWRMFAEVKRGKMEWRPDRFETLTNALSAYEKSLKNLNQSFSKLKSELEL
jgi:hypothetical protein